MSARILVVDDILANRRLLQAKLEARYYQVLMADSGPVAIDIAAREQPDIILLDVMMPGMDGYEVTRRLKSDPVTEHIPIVMLTALNQAEHRIMGLEAGADDFVTKPIDDFALFSRISALMRYHAVASELRQRDAHVGIAAVDSDVERQEMGKPPRVVVVDQNERTRRQIISTLSSAGHVATDYLGSTGMNIRGIDVMILSLKRQSFDPLRLCAQFKLGTKTRGIAIIVACDEVGREMAGRALELGASDVIEEPIDPQELIARVNTQTRRTRYLDIMRKRVDRGIELSVIDPLTGLYNRRYMMTQLSQHLQRTAHGATPVSIVALDIDHFKDVNDTHGHAVGDLVLQEFSRRLKDGVRPSDIACRPGGEEFVVIMPDTEGDVARKVAERVRMAVAGECFDVEGPGGALSVTVSAGVASSSPSANTPDDILRHADEALYHAKKSGRNRVESVAA